MKSDMKSVFVLLIIIAISVFFYFTFLKSDTSISTTTTPTDTDEQKVTVVTFEFKDEDGNVHVERLAKPATALQAFEGISDEDIQTMIKEIPYPLDGITDIRINFTVTNIGNVPISVDFEEGVMEGIFNG